ncbi:LysE family translocator [Leclercia pneumoniae]|uniref:LysE family translocator n=1 Tax=Leclercia pneumoniae TaxID=2815358 RepID=UPI003AF803AE
MVISLFATYLFSVVLLLITPGPVVALVTHTALRQGYRRAFITVAGSNLASLMLIVGAVVMLSGAVRIHPLSLPLAGVAGSLYLGWLAADLWWQGGTEAHDELRRGGFGVGFFTAIANSKDILFFAAFFPQFIRVTPDFALSVTLLTLGWVILDLLILSLWILSVRRCLPARSLPVVNRLMALFLAGVALSGLVLNSQAAFNVL